MLSNGVLLVIGLFQLAFVGGVTWLLFFTDRRMRGQDLAHANAPLELRGPLQKFLLLGEGCDELASALSRLSPALASRQVERLGATLLASEQLEKLARRLRSETWVAERLEKAKSRRWWKRMAAARLLPMVCSENDGTLLARLVMDRHPAVAAAATAAISPHADAALIARIIRTLPRRSPTLRLQQMQALRSHAAVATPILTRALSDKLSPKDVQVMVQLAEVLATPAAFSAIVSLASHPSPDVRTSVARALRGAFVPGAVEAAESLLFDSDWRVRAAAARALEGLRVISAIPKLSDALRDEQWWVRFRAAGALAALGDYGRIALEEAIGADDPYARDMAISIGSLSEANRLEQSG
jgi:hypothetical protein